MALNWPLILVFVLYSISKSQIITIVMIMTKQTFIIMNLYFPTHVKITDRKHRNLNSRNSEMCRSARGHIANRPIMF